VNEKHLWKNFNISLMLPIKKFEVLLNLMKSTSIEPLVSSQTMALVVNSALCSGSTQQRGKVKICNIFPHSHHYYETAAIG
jgi:hypothetical protein